MKIWKIDITGPYGYSFAVKTDATTPESAIACADDADLFDSPEDADYATAEEITDSPYDIKGLENCTYEV